jgi:hypothetical protein
LCCVILLAVLSLLPAQEMVRTDLPGQFEHFIAYAGSAAIAMAGYGLSRRRHADYWRLLGLRRRSGVSPAFFARPASSLEDFGASALGALCGGLAVSLLCRPFWNALHR